MDRAEVAFLVGCLLPCLVAAYTDVRAAKVGDRITIPVLLSGLVAAVYEGAVYDALLGAAFAFAVFLCCCMVGGVGGGDLKLATGIGMWFGFSSAVYVLLLAGVLGFFWGACKLLRMGKLKGWAGLFFTGLYLRAAYGAKGAVPLSKLPEDEEAPPPAEAVPFGACLAAAAWCVWLSSATADGAVVSLGCGAGVIVIFCLLGYLAGKQGEEVN